MKRYLLGIVLLVGMICGGSQSSFADLTVTISTPTSVPDGNICASAANVVLYEFTLTATAGTSTSHALSGLTFTNTGTASASVTSYKLWAGSVGGSPVATSATTSFSSFSPTQIFSGPDGTTVNYIITATISGATSGQTLVVSPLATTDISLSGVSANTVLTSGSIASGGTQTVQAAPTIIGGTLSVCASAMTTLTDGITGGTWTSSNTTVAAVGSVSGQITSGVVSGTTTITYSTGCPSDAIAIVTVNTTPTDVTAGASPNPVCSGASLSLTSTSIGGVTYSWSGPGFAGATTTGSTFIASVGNTGTFTFSVTNTCGSNHATVAVSVNPLPSLSAGGPIITICNGSSTTLNATAGLSSYSWLPTAGLSPATGSPVTANPTSTTVYTVTGTNSSGCSNTAIVTVSVNPVPTITGTPGGRCGPGIVVLGASATPGAIINWYALVSGGSSSGTGTSYNTPSISTNTTYYANATANGCTSAPRISVLATINTLPTISGTTPAARCGSGTVTLGAASAGTLTWYGGAAGGPSLGTGASFTTPTSISSTTTYYVDATTGGCTSSPRTAVAATVNSLPTVASITPSSTSLCTGTQLVLTAGSVAGTGSLISYNWSGPGGYSAAGANAMTTVSPASAVSGVYSVSVTYPGSGCTSITHASTVVTVNPQPSVTGISPSTPNPCPGGSLTLTANGTFTGVTNYIWSGPGLPSSTGSSAMITTTVTTAGTYNVTAINHGTGCNNSINTLAFTPSTTPSIASLTASSSTICTGSLLTLTAGATSGTGPLTSYNWTGPNGYNVTGTSTNASFTASSIIQSGTYSVTATYPGSGCTSTFATSPHVTVNTRPTISGVTASHPTLCTGSTLVLTAGSPAGTGGLTSYNWSGPGGYSSTSTVNNASVILTGTGNSGTYNLSVTYPGTGCTSPSVGTSVTVNNLPTITGITPSPVSLCTGALLTFTAGSHAGTGTLSSYNWSGPNSYGSTTTGSTVSFTPTSTAASGVYSLTVTYPGFGCTSAAAVTSPAVTVNPAPSLASISVAPATLCVGSTLTLTGNGASGTGEPVYSWSGPDGYSSTNNGPTQTEVASNTGASGIYSLTVTYPGAGCTTNSVMSGNITVNPFPTVSAITATPKLCVGAQLSLTVTSSGTGTATYAWSGPNGYSSSATGTTGSTQTYTVPATTASGIYSLTVTYPGTGCTPAPVVSNAVVVDANPAVPTFNIIPDSICQNSRDQKFSASGSSDVTAYSWSVSASNDNISGKNKQACLVDFIASGNTTITVTVHNANGCHNSAETAINAGSSVSDPDTIINFESSLVCLQRGVTYAWGREDSATLSNQPLTGDINNQNYYFGDTVLNPASFYFVVTTEGGCNQKSYYHVPPGNKGNNTGTANSGLGQMKVYPNPAGSYLDVQFDNLENNVELRITDIMGRELMRLPVQDATTKIDVSLLQPAIYLIDCYLDGVKVANSKFVKN